MRRAASRAPGACASSGSNDVQPEKSLPNADRRAQSIVISIRHAMSAQQYGSRISAPEHPLLERGRAAPKHAPQAGSRYMPPPRPPTRVATRWISAGYGAPPEGRPRHARHCGAPVVPAGADRCGNVIQCARPRIVPTGTVRAIELLRVLQGGGRPTPLGRAIAELAAPPRRCTSCTTSTATRTGASACTSTATKAATPSPASSSTASAANYVTPTAKPKKTNSSSLRHPPWA